MGKTTRDANSKTDIILLSGFLGAGKTTVLNELIHFFPDAQKGILANDFGEVPVDGALIRQVHPGLAEGGHTIYEIGNGSIFCSCLKASFILGLKYFAREKPEFLIIEASGLSDPFGMDKILREHDLDWQFKLKQIVTLVDPVRYKALKHVLPVIGRQVEAADHILVNKVDLVSSRDLSQIENSIREISDVPLQKASFGHFDYSFVHKATEHRIREEGESRNTPGNRPSSLFLEGPVENESLLREFMTLAGKKAYRIKGFLELEGTMRYISDRGRGFDISHAPKTGIREGLTVLCPGKYEKTIAGYWEDLKKSGKQD